MSRIKENKKKGMLFKIIAIIYLIITALFCWSILKMDLLPGKYVLVFCLIELLLTVFITLGLWKEHKTKKLNVVCIVIVAILAIIYGVAINYANATSNFLGGLFKNTEETEEYYIVVQKNSQYSKISDLKNKEIVLFQIEDDVKVEIEKKIEVSFNKKDSLSEVGNSLMDGYAEAIAISSSQYDMLDGEITDFKSNTKIIYTATHVVDKEEEEDSQYTIANKSFNIYISGIDTSGSISNVARSDANIIVTVNLETHEILLTSIPRDYYVTLHKYKAKDKLTHSGIYGINETVSTVEDLLDIDISYYVRVNFTTVIKLVDELGGVDVNSEYNFSSNGYTFKKGINHLDGDEALIFSRERHSFIDGDNQRVKNQQAVISAIVDKVTSSTTILTKYTDLLSALDGCFQTNMQEDDIKAIVKNQLNTMPTWKITSNSLTGSDAHKSTYSMGSQELYVMIPNETSVKEATQKINDILEK